MGKKLLIILLFFISFALWGELKIEMSSDSQNYTLDDTISLTIAVTKVAHISLTDSLYI